MAREKKTDLSAQATFRSLVEHQLYKSNAIGSGVLITVRFDDLCNDTDS